MKEVFLQALSSVSVILLLTATGYLLGVKGLMDKKAKTFISKLLMSLLVPFNCINGIITNLTRETISQYGIYLLISLAAMALSNVLAFLICKLFRVPKNRTGLFIHMGANSNAIFIGLAICRELFGDASAPYVMVFYVLNSFSIWLVSVIAVRWSFDYERERFGKLLLKVLLSPPVIGVSIGLVLVLLDIQLPTFASSFIRHLSSMVTPLAIMMTGFIIYELGLKSLVMDKSTALLLLMRFVLAPGIFFIIFKVLGMEGLGPQTTMIVAAMPAPTMAVVLGSQYGGEEGEKFASQGVVWTTLAMFIVTPLLRVLIA
ncbi:MAG: AEC family transporter [Lachnospiraceae bacterium]|nr:AEC family transporter [Lachnospiraceae bacterium]